MAISSVNGAAAAYSFSETQNITKEQMETLLAAGNQVKQAPLQQRMVETINAAVQNGHVDVYA